MHHSKLDRVNLITQGKGWERAPLDGECWGINDMIVHRPLTVAFHMHDLGALWAIYSDEMASHSYALDDKIVDDEIRPWLDNVCCSHQYSVLLHFKKIVERVTELGIPLISVREYQGIPTSVRYPIEEIIETFGTTYFTNSISYMLAYALWCGFREIYIYGCKMEQQEEILRDKSNLEFWLGIARGMGVKVVLDGEANLLETRNHVLYGFDYARKYGQERDPYLGQRTGMDESTRYKTSMGDK